VRRVRISRSNPRSVTVAANTPNALIHRVPDETEPGEHAYALVVYTGDSKEVGVRCLERAAIRNGFGVHVFAWQPMQYPNLGIDDVGKVVDQYRRIPKLAVSSS